jgi:hypothetical protein
VDRFLAAFTDALVTARARDPRPEELRRAFQATTRVLPREIHRDPPDLAMRLRDPLEEPAMP